MACSIEDALSVPGCILQAAGRGLPMNIITVRPDEREGGARAEAGAQTTRAGRAGGGEALTCMVTSLSSTITSFVRKSAPIVALYWLLNFLFTYWFMSEVFPTLKLEKNHKSKSGRTALHTASDACSLEGLSVLQNRGEASSSPSDGHGQRPTNALLLKEAPAVTSPLAPKSLCRPGSLHLVVVIQSKRGTIRGSHWLPAHIHTSQPICCCWFSH